ncbi:pectinesterase family protein [Parasediminibacterium sp. JCM 36343]|uniref:pectinesterase family protein n=1 Tax=Parasediminibacterium sp. JCM 36343 TaxID=3374279 RepID=UPI00397AD31B
MPTTHFCRYMLKYMVALLPFLFISNIGMAQKKDNTTKQITVSQDGKGNFKTIQEAIDALRAYSPEHITINIKNGVYHEKIIIPATVTNISIEGESREGVIITNDDYSGKFMNADTVNEKKKFSTFNSYTMHISGNDITIEHLTIKNGAGRVGQGVALHVDGDRFVINDCNLTGNQDTLLTANDNSRQYYTNCFIEGTTDFIFGNATVVFKNCTIKSLTNSYVTAASTTQHQKFGYVFMNCKLIANEEAQKVYLGRPWRPYARVVFMNCELGKHIRPEGWHNWNKIENEGTAYYAEYKNTGEGAATDKRVSWCKQLTEDEAKEYTIQNIFNDWKPF